MTESPSHLDRRDAARLLLEADFATPEGDCWCSAGDFSDLCRCREMDVVRGHLTRIANLPAKLPPDPFMPQNAKGPGES